MQHSLADSTTADKNHHFVTFPFPLTERPAGGLPSVVLEDVRLNRGKQVSFFTTDKVSQNWEGCRIEAADQAPFPPEFFNLCFGTGLWTVLLDRAHLELGKGGVASAESIRAMYPADARAELLADLHAEMKIAAVPEIGTLAFMLRYVEKFAPSYDVLINYNKRFERVLREELLDAPGDPTTRKVNFQDFFFLPLIDTFANSLRDRGLFTSYHHHTPLVGTLHQSNLGRMMLKGMSKVDAVYVHTEGGADNLQMQLELLNLPKPEIRLFNMGIDCDYFDQALGTINTSNYSTAISEFFQLSERQQLLLHSKAAAERAGVHHVVTNGDRADPPKGLVTYLDAVREFLTERASIDGRDKLKDKYRFLGYHDLLLIDSSRLNPLNMQHQYIRLCLSKYKALEQDFPGVVMFCEGFGGRQLNAVPWLMHGTTCVSGGALDGSRKMSMEEAYVNRDQNVGQICGQGAGIFDQLTRANLQSSALWPEPGNVKAFVESFKETFRLQVSRAGELVARRAPFIGWIRGRGDSILVSK